MKLRSDAFLAGGEIPRRYTCEAEDMSPPLSWSEAPSAAKSFVLIADDPDAPDPAAPTVTWVHWVLYNLPPSVSNLHEGARPLPAGTEVGLNDWKIKGYGGPCPPIGRHRYFFKLYALDTTLPRLAHPTKSNLLDEMKGHVLAETHLIGTYQKARR